MYLRGGKWNMHGRRRRFITGWRVVFLIFFAGSLFYINQFIVPYTPGFSAPTPTPTRDPESFVREAEELYNQGKLLQAIDAYEAAIQADPLNKANFITLARIQIWAGEYEQALENAEKALVGNDDYALAHAVRGWALGFLNDTLMAEAELKEAIRLDPNSALAHAYYAEILADRGDYGDLERAIEESNIAMSLDPNLLETLRARAYVLYMTGNFQESIAKYQAALSINKNISDLHLFIGRNYDALGEYDQAISSFLQANALNPTDPYPDLLASQTYARVGEFGKAVQYAENAVKDDPENPYRYGNLGVMLFKSGNMSEAIENFKYAIHGGETEEGFVVEGLPLDYGYPAQYYWTYAFALAESVPHRCSEAVPIFQALLTTVSNDETAVYNGEAGLEFCKELAEGGGE